MGKKIKQQEEPAAYLYCKVENECWSGDIIKPLYISQNADYEKINDDSKYYVYEIYKNGRLKQI